ncbi:tRNA-dihydrouridine synthase 4 [Apiospora arundinis]
MLTIDEEWDDNGFHGEDGDDVRGDIDIQLEDGDAGWVLVGIGRAAEEVGQLLVIWAPHQAVTRNYYAGGSRGFVTWVI